MLHVDVSSGEKPIKIRRQLWQYDYGQHIYFTGLDDARPIRADFSVEVSDVIANPCYAEKIGDGYLAEIPDSLLAIDTADNYKIYCYLSAYTGTEDETVRTIIFDVTARTKPEGYVPGGDPNIFDVIFAKLRTVESNTDQNTFALGGLQFEEVDGEVKVSKGGVE